MSVVVVTGSGGLIGSETVKVFSALGHKVIGIDNDMRSYFFGQDASTKWNSQQLQDKIPGFEPHEIDIRNQDDIFKLFQKYENNIYAVVHTAAQPSHDWAANEPFTDFTVNANGTLTLLEATRKFAPNATFVFTSTNKVYGDLPNSLPLVEQATRWELDSSHNWAEHGIDESMSIDQSKHSLFGASKVAADVLVQEYGRYFDINTACFRGGCLTGPAHSGAELHGFLAYLIKCVVTCKPYTIFGYGGKQVRDNIHSNDLVNAFVEFCKNPKPGKVYNIGGSRHSNCSVLEAIAMSEQLVGKKLNFTLSDQARSGDHIWWVSDVRAFQRDYPEWSFKYDINTIVKEIVESTLERNASQSADLT